MKTWLPDVIGFLGVVLLGVGVGIYSIAAALVCVGGLLILLAVNMAKAGADHDT